MKAVLGSPIFRGGRAGHRVLRHTDSQLKIVRASQRNCRHCQVKEWTSDEKCPATVLTTGNLDLEVLLLPLVGDSEEVTWTEGERDGRYGYKWFYGLRFKFR